MRVGSENMLKTCRVDLFSLYNAVQALCDEKVHRLPIMDKASGNILYILTHKKILRFLYVYVSTRGSVFLVFILIGPRIFRFETFPHRCSFNGHRKSSESGRGKRF